MLIVVAIIAILSSVFLVGLKGFREGAYDSRRISDLQKVQSYLEVYYTKNRAYPNIAFSETSWDDGSCGGSTLCKELKEKINIVIPNDPIKSNNYYYGVSSDKQGYVLGTKLTPGHSVYGESSTIKTTTYSVPCDGSTVFCIQF